MNNIIKKAVNICRIMIWPLSFLISQILIISIFTFFFNEQQLKIISVNHPSLTLQEQNNLLLEYINTADYNHKLNQYINDNTLFIILISAMIVLPLFLKIYRKNKLSSSLPLNKKNYWQLIIIGITSAIALNIIIYLLNTKIHFTNAYDPVSKNYLLILISSGIIGPIIEELLFRGIVYEKLKQITSIKKATIISVIIFALFHQEPSQIVYAALIGTILIKVYQKTNIIGSIIVHISANCSITVCMYFLIMLPILALIFVIIIMLVLFQINYKKISYQFNE